MWALSNRTRYAAERTWTRDKTGQHHWIVAVRATFEIAADGALQLADDQPPPLLAPEYLGEPGASSLRYDADLGPTKPTTDVLVNGFAYAPGGRPATSVRTRLVVGEIDKQLVVHGPRRYRQGERGPSPSAAEPFIKQPITYEWAFGGSDLSDPDPRNQRMDPRNPVGKGIAARPETLEHQPAHHVEYPAGKPASAGPAGYGAIASYWSPRRELAGTYDGAWEASQKPLLPQDYDERFVLCAPADQRASKHLRGGEAVTLLNLTPEGTLGTTLPKIHLTYRTTIDGRAEEHRGKLATVILEPEQRQLILVWQTSLLVRPTEVDYLDETVIDEKAYIR